MVFHLSAEQKHKVRVICYMRAVYQRLRLATHSQFEDEGCLVIENFMQPETVQQLLNR